MRLSKRQLNWARRIKPDDGHRWHVYVAALRKLKKVKPSKNPKKVKP